MDLPQLQTQTKLGCMDRILLAVSVSRRGCSSGAVPSFYPFLLFRSDAGCIRVA
jgi:hypothetical protein